MKIFLLIPLFLSGLVSSNIYSQTKLLEKINSVKTKEIIEFKYNKQNQLVYFDEKGVVTYREFTLKYDKSTNRLTECTVNQDWGELVQQIKYTYNTDHILQQTKSSGKQVHSKNTDNINIYIDDKGRLTKTMFDDGKVWEEFEYDENNNIAKYILHSAMGEKDVVTTYKYEDNNSDLSHILDLPSWFWAWNMNNMKWCSDFVGENLLKEFTVVHPRYGTDIIEVTYEYDKEGYPIKQYYDNELVKEFFYKTVNPK